MSETIGERMSRYVLDSSDEDLQRLLKIAELECRADPHGFRALEFDYDSQC